MLPDSIYTFDKVMTSLGIIDPPDFWRKHWDVSQQVFEGADLGFLEDRYIDDMDTLLRLHPDAMKAFHDALKLIRGNQNLQWLAWHWHYQLFHVDLEPGESFAPVYKWPNPEVMGALAPMFPAVIAASGIPHMQEINKTRSIPDDISNASLGDLNIWLLDYHSKYGSWGLTHLVWLLSHLTGRLYQLGRLQFVAAECTLPARFFKNVNDCCIIAVSEPGIRYRSDGQVDGLNGITDPNAWVSELDIAAEIVRGNPITPLGGAQCEVVELQTKQWKQILAPGDGIIEVHIHAGGRMDYSACVDSFSQALKFFPTYFPNTSFAGFTCQSWLLDPNLEQILPAESNIVRFGKLFYRVPVAGGDWQTFERAFGVNKPDDLSTLPRDTTLRRAILDYLAAGNQMWVAGGFIPRDE